jgi:hypothetical protein
MPLPTMQTSASTLLAKEAITHCAPIGESGVLQEGQQTRSWAEKLRQERNRSRRRFPAAREEIIEVALLDVRQGVEPGDLSIVQFKQPREAFAR